jgi:L-cysteine desulfidase
MARSFELLLVSALSALVGNALEGKALVAGLVFVATSFSKKRDLVLVAASHLVAGVQGLMCRGGSQACAGEEICGKESEHEGTCARVA